MQDAFEGFFWGGGEYRTWFHGGSGVTMALGLLGAEGQLEILDPSFDYEVTDVSDFAMAFEASYLYRFRRSLAARTWFPYAGVGGES
jgi:hypothetical protein